MPHIPARSRGSLKARAGKSYVIRELVLPVQAFIYTEGLSGIVLFVATLIALVWANSPWSDSYFELWKTYLSIDLGFFKISESLLHWINDALMVIFFFVVGLEVKRELLHGTLNDRRRAMLPLMAGLGGMVMPAALYFIFNMGGTGEAGWGIPMATDIAFALGLLTLLGKRVPMELRIFLLAFAIVDDIGAIIVIALFYTSDISWNALWIAAGILGVLFGMNRARVHETRLYGLVGVLLWLAVFESGLHPTLAGVLLAMFIPSRSYFSRSTYLQSMEILLRQFREALENKQKNREEAVLGRIEELSKDTESPLERLEREIHPWASYVVLPVFALANAGIVFTSDALTSAFNSPVTWGILIGLLVGKPIGIFGFSWLAIRLNLASLPKSVNWVHIFGAGVFAGIGFTVSLFISGLSFTDEAMVSQSKMGILIGSLIAGVIGCGTLLMTRRKDQLSSASG